MRSILGFAFVLVVASAAISAPPQGPVCQTFVSASGNVLVFTSDKTATFKPRNQPLQECATDYGSGDEASYEPYVHVQCDPSSTKYDVADEATFPTSYKEPRLTFRGEDFKRDCSQDLGL